MSIADPPVPAVAAPTNLEDLLTLEDGVERDIINGELWERPASGELRECPMTRRNRWHSSTEARIVKLLGVWLDTRPAPRGEILSGEAGFRLRREPLINVGIDVAYASAELVASTDPDDPYYDGPPVLAVEILSPSDQHGEVVRKVGLYLEAGTVVWVVDPDFRLITVHRRGHPPLPLNETRELTGEPELPGFRVRVADLFPA